MRIGERSKRVVRSAGRSLSIPDARLRVSPVGVRGKDVGLQPLKARVELGDRRGEFTLAQGSVGREQVDRDGTPGVECCPFHLANVAGPLMAQRTI